MRSIPTEYLKGKNREQQAELKRLWRINNAFIDAFKEVVDSRIEELNNSSLDDYNIHNWPYFRADRDGYLRALKEMRKLLP